MNSEFEFIQNIKKKYGLKYVGDDCAVLPKDPETDMVITADMLVEDIDFRLDWTIPEFLGHKALAVSLSDVAAMGAEPNWAMLSIAVPEAIWKSDFLNRFYDGWHRLAAEFGIELVGGDVSRAPESIVIDSIVGGDVQRGQAILRSGAKAGEAIFVSGTLGAASGGLKLLESDLRYDQEHDDSGQNLIRRQLQPSPKMEVGKLLRSRNLASAMIDISDGLSSDVMHICEQSGIGARIDELPVDPDLYEHFTNDESMIMALHGGEDFELLFTVPSEKISGLEDLSVTRIGTTTANIGIIEFIRDGKFEILPPKGYRHF